MKYFKIFFLILFASQFGLATVPLCRGSLLEPRKLEIEIPQTSKFDPGLPYSGYFTELRTVIKDNRQKIESILSKFNNDQGNKIELTQVFSFLEKVNALELANLRKIETLDNIVIYGSSNVPLYSLVTQGILAASFGRDVWFRTPEISRDVYVQLFDLLRSQLAPPALKNFHLVTEASDVNYDMFNRIYVMGMNRAGTRNIRKPADLVLLTGSPETARRMIDRNQKKLQELAPQFPGFKQMFIGFLAGINPAVVTASSKFEMDRVVQQIIEPVLINSGQDCMNSDVIFVHKDVYTKFYDTLTTELRQIPLLQQGQHGKGFIPLSFAKNLDKLIAYKEKYKNHLQNASEASINSNDKVVNPHIFKFKFSELENLEIQEHFAPFFTVVTYDSLEQIESALKSPRFQSKAMFGLLYGSTKLDYEQSQLRDLFRQYGHGVVHNSTLFDEFEMNFPFGGTGTDTSLIVKNQVSADGALTSQWAHYPTLISKEARSFFPRIHAIEGVREIEPAARAESLNYVNQILAAAEGVGSLKPDWRIKKPNLNSSPTDLRTIQKLAKTKGLHILSSNMFALNPDQLALTEKLYGVPFITNDDRGKSIEGVVIHDRSLNENYDPFNFARGELNPNLGYGQLSPLISANKFFDFQVIRAFDPSLMPPTQLLSEMNSFERFGEVFEKQRSQLLVDLKAKPAGNTETVADMLRYLFAKVQKFYPEGAYFKNYGEFATGDMGTTVTSFSTSPLAMAKEFISVYLKTPDLKKIAESQDYDNYARFIARALLDPSKILIQKVEQIKKTDLGQNVEIRVDFISGQTVGSRMRYGYEFYPDELTQAQSRLQEFIDKLPPQMRNMSGGADLAQLADGRWIILEFNFGAESGTRVANFYPLEANRIYSKLIGKKTFFLKELDRVSGKPIAEQKAYILKFKNEKPPWWRYTIDDISRLEIARYLRDLMLEKWMKSSEKERLAAGVIDQLTELLDGIGSEENQDFKKLLHSSKQFIYRSMK